MKNTIAALICAITLASAPVHAGNLSDPLVTPEVIATDAAEQSTGNIDHLVFMVWLSLLAATAGGAF